MFAADGDASETGAADPDGTYVPVSDEDLEADARDAEPVEDDFELLAAEFSRFKELMDNRAYDEADSVAKRIIELAIKTKGADSTEMARALTNLAIVQHQTGEYDAARQNYTSAIEIIEDVEDRLNEALVNPLKGLAAAQLESGRPDLASTTYRRAVHVTHVNEGPHNLAQIDLLESLAEVQLRMGDIQSAKEMQDTIYALNVRKYHTDTLGLIPSLMRRAEWQHRAGLIFDERATYRRAIRIIEERLGRDDIALVEPLLMLGRSFFYIDMSGATSMNQATMSTGEIYFKRALRIAAESPDSTWRAIADATLALGDFYMHEGSPQRARPVYRNAWDLLSEPDQSGNKLEKRRTELEHAVALKQTPLPPFIGESNTMGAEDPGNPLFEGRVTMSYSISARGRVADLKLVEAEPAEFEGMRKTVQQELRRRVFRPGFKDGEPVTIPDQVFTHTFYYRQSDLDAARETSPADVDDT
jgi:tetratricopeptide (TPR) repeat protein